MRRCGAFVRTAAAIATTKSRLSSTSAFSTTPSGAAACSSASAGLSQLHKATYEAAFMVSVWANHAAGWRLTRTLALYARRTWG